MVVSSIEMNDMAIQINFNSLCKRIELLNSKKGSKSVVATLTVLAKLVKQVETNPEASLTIDWVENTPHTKAKLTINV